MERRIAANVGNVAARVGVVVDDDPEPRPLGHDARRELPEDPDRVLDMMTTVRDQLPDALVIEGTP